LSADGPGLIPSELDVECGLVNSLIVDWHGSDLVSGLPQTRFPLLTLRELNEAAFEQRYLLPGVLAAGQAGGIYGQFKTLKTSCTADLLLSDATGPTSWDISSSPSRGRSCSSLIESGMFEKFLAMDGRRGAPGFRVTRGWADPSSRTTRAVQLDKPIQSTWTGRSAVT